MSIEFSQNDRYMQIQSDHQLALVLSESENDEYENYNHQIRSPRSTNSIKANNNNNNNNIDCSLSLFEHENGMVHHVTHDSPKKQELNIDYEAELYSLYVSDLSNNNNNNNKFESEDWSLARTLQGLEFQMDHEIMEQYEIDNDFDRKENRAVNCKKQLITLSTFLCVIQILLLIIMIYIDGYATKSENPMIGPPVSTLVRFGAKDTGLIVHKQQYWRLVTPIMLHAGILHIVSNVFIQLRVGGYLNLVFGWKKWFIIYLGSGLFGNLCSCCFMPDSVGVGSSGAVLGMLSSWIVWLIFRWKKIPVECKGQRNCQLIVVVTSVTVTLAMSFGDLIDWGAHFGGFIQGILLGAALLSNELDNEKTKKIVFFLSITISISLFLIALYVVFFELNPSKQNWEYYLQNDDWGRR